MIKPSGISGVNDTSPFDNHSHNTQPADDKAGKPHDNNKGQKTLQMPEELGGNGGLEPTRYGDWLTANGRCSDF